MAKRVDPTVEILKQIREELVTTRLELGARIEGTNERIDRMNERIDRTNERLESVERRQVSGEVRVATELVAVVRAVDGVRELLRERLDVRDRVDDHEKRLTALERKTA